MMKKLVKRFAALALALLMAALIPMGALAEDAGITTPTDLQPVAETPVEKEPAIAVEEQQPENASNVTEAEVTAEPTVAPIAEPTAAPTAEPTAEPTEEPSIPVSEEPTAEPTVEPVEEQLAEIEETVEITEVEPTEEPTPTPTEEPAVTDQPAEEPTESLEEIVEETTEEPAAPAMVTIILRTAGPIYYGDEVTLGVIVENVESDYTITWQVKVGENRWESVEVGLTYKFILTAENAANEYRAVLTIIE